MYRFAKVDAGCTHNPIKVEAGHDLGIAKPGRHEFDTAVG